jgi:hypothetical protein
MHFLVTLQHLHELRNSFRARLGLLDGLNPEQDSIPVSAVKSSKEGFGSRIAIERGLKIAWHHGLAGRVVCGFPTSIAFGALNLCPC